MCVHLCVLHYFGILQVRTAENNVSKKGIVSTEMSLLNHRTFVDVVVELTFVSTLVSRGASHTSTNWMA